MEEHVTLSHIPKSTKRQLNIYLPPLFSYRSIESWRSSTCNTSCWQCIEDESNVRMCYHAECTRNCQLRNNTEPSPEFDLTLLCEGKILKHGDHIQPAYRHKEVIAFSRAPCI